MFSPSPPADLCPSRTWRRSRICALPIQLERFSHAYFPLAVVPAPRMPLAGSASIPSTAPFAMVVIATAIRSLISPLRAMKRAARFQMSRRSNGSQHRRWRRCGCHSICDKRGFQARGGERDRVSRQGRGTGPREVSRLRYHSKIRASGVVLRGAGIDRTQLSATGSLDMLMYWSRAAERPGKTGNSRQIRRSMCQWVERPSCWIVRQTCRSETGCSYSAP